MSSGTPLSWYNGNEYTLDWTNGTQLKSAKKGLALKTTYTYDMAGVRSSKTVGGVTKYEFTTLSGLVMRQEWGTRQLDFIYDENNQPYALTYKSGNKTPVMYYYLLNQQGNVEALMDASGAIVATYEYDPWGAVTVKNASGALDNDDTSIGNLNPLRYRGYYYDNETGFYYLESRYYDPAVGRFISADIFASTDVLYPLSANMFAYCENSPVCNSDSTGEYRMIEGYEPPCSSKKPIEPKPYVAGSFNQYGNEYGNGLYFVATPPNLNRGITIGSIDTGIASIGGDYNYFSWNLNTVHANTQAGISLDYVGFSACASLVSGEAGIKVPIPFTGKKLYIGAEGELFAVGVKAYWDREKRRVAIGAADVVGVVLILGLEGEDES